MNIKKNIDELKKFHKDKWAPFPCKLIYSKNSDSGIITKLGYLGYSSVISINDNISFNYYLAHNYIPYELPLEISIKDLIEINFFGMDMSNYKKIYPSETPVEITSCYNKYNIGYIKDKNDIINQRKNNDSIDKIIMYKSIKNGKFKKPSTYKNIIEITSLAVIKTINFRS